jgi:hypothetical protein
VCVPELPATMTFFTSVPPLAAASLPRSRFISVPSPSVESDCDGDKIASLCSCVICSCVRARSCPSSGRPGSICESYLITQSRGHARVQLVSLSQRRKMLMPCDHAVPTSPD